MGGKTPTTRLHLRFNPANSRHMEAAAFIDSVKARYKNALIAAAIEAYRELHPFGVDYAELEGIQKQTWQDFRPASPIQHNLREREPELKTLVPERRTDNSAGAKVAEAMDRAIDFFNLNDDE